MKMLGGGKDDRAGGGDGGQQQRPARQQRAPSPAPAAPPASRNGYADAKSGRAAPAPPAGTGFDDMDDDIPF